MFLATMNAWQWILPIGLGLLLGVLLASRKNYDYSKIITLSPEDFRLNMRKGQLLDLRDEKSFSEKRINGSRNFPKSSVFQSLSKIRKDQPVFLYDNTSSVVIRHVSKKLIRKGFKPVYVLQGGLEKWSYPLKEE